MDKVKSFCIEAQESRYLYTVGPRYSIIRRRTSQTKWPYSTSCLFDCILNLFFSSGISILSAMLVQNPEVDEARMYYFLGMFKYRYTS